MGAILKRWALVIVPTPANLPYVSLPEIFLKTLLTMCFLQDFLWGQYDSFCCKTNVAWAVSQTAYDWKGLTLIYPPHLEDFKFWKWNLIAEGLISLWMKASHMSLERRMSKLYSETNMQTICIQIMLININEVDGKSKYLFVSKLYKVHRVK